MKEHIHKLLDTIGLCPRYIAFESEQPPTLLRFEGAFGSTGRSLDMLVADWLQQRGEWVGRQPLLWINDVAIEREADMHAAECGLSREEFIELSTAAVGLHEGGHIAEHPIDLEMPPESMRQTKIKLAAYAEVFHESLSLPPFHQHGWQFIRNCAPSDLAGPASRLPDSGQLGDQR